MRNQFYYIERSKVALIGFNKLDLCCRFEDELVVAVGKGEPAEVMSEYGFK